MSGEQESDFIESSIIQIHKLNYVYIFMFFIYYVYKEIDL